MSSGLLIAAVWASWLAVCAISVGWRVYRHRTRLSRTARRVTTLLVTLTASTDEFTEMMRRTADEFDRFAAMGRGGRR